MKGNKQTLVPIGKSDYDLVPFANKPAIINVDYPKPSDNIRRYITNQQCIKGVCRYLHPNKQEVSVVVNIISIKPVKEAY